MASPDDVMSRTASSHSDSFTYPGDSQQELASHNPIDDDEEEFVYPTPSPTHDPAPVPVDAPPLEALQLPDIITSSASPSAAESQEAVPLEQPVETESPSSSTALHQSSPPAPSSPSPSPSPPTQIHASPAQLEALYAAASSGDLLLLQGIIRNASQTGNVEPFSLVNDASSRTGLTALHASASRGYLDIVKWRKIILIY